MSGRCGAPTAAERRRRIFFTPKSYLHTSFCVQKMGDPELRFRLHRVFFAYVTLAHWLSCGSHGSALITPLPPFGPSAGPIMLAPRVPESPPRVGGGVLSFASFSCVSPVRNPRIDSLLTHAIPFLPRFLVFFHESTTMQSHPILLLPGLRCRDCAAGSALPGVRGPRCNPTQS